MMNTFDWVLVIVFSLFCLLAWGSIIAQIVLHRERMRMISENHEAYKRRVAAQVTAQIRQVSGDNEYQLGGEINWAKKQEL